MIQPQVLTTIAAQAGLPGTGFLARFLYARPVSKVGRRKIGRAGRPRRSSRPRGRREGSRDRHGRLARRQPAVLTLTEDARAEFERIEAAVEPTLAGDGELACWSIGEPSTSGAVARIAGIMHLAEHGADDGAAQVGRRGDDQGRRADRRVLQGERDQRVRRDGHRPGHSRRGLPGGAHPPPPLRRGVRA